MKVQNFSSVLDKTTKCSTLFSFFAALFLTLSFSNQAQAQVYVNIPSQAIWGPVGYDHVDYYYLPEADAFYSVNSKKFIYWNGKQNVYVNTLPSSRNVNLFTTYKVVVNKPKPYLNHGYYVSHYKKYKKGGPKQYIIRDSHHEKYYVVKGHPKHGQQYSKGNKVVIPSGSHGNKVIVPQGKQQKSQGSKIIIPSGSHGNKVIVPQGKQQKAPGSKISVKSPQKGSPSKGGNGGKGKGGKK